MKVYKHPTSQPTPRLITEGGTGVAPPYLAVAKNIPVDCKIMIFRKCPAIKYVFQTIENTTTIRY